MYLPIIAFSPFLSNDLVIPVFCAVLCYALSSQIFMPLCKKEMAASSVVNRVVFKKYEGTMPKDNKHQTGNSRLLRDGER